MSIRVSTSTINTFHTGVVQCSFHFFPGLSHDLREAFARGAFPLSAKIGLRWDWRLPRNHAVVEERRLIPSLFSPLLVPLLAQLLFPGSGNSNRKSVAKLHFPGSGKANWKSVVQLLLPGLGKSNWKSVAKLLFPGSGKAIGRLWLWESVAQSPLWENATGNLWSSARWSVAIRTVWRTCFLLVAGTRRK